MNCCVVPSGMLGTAGVTAIETNAAGVTVRLVDPETFPDVAVAVVVPTATLLARPALLMVATPLSPVLQTAEFVMSRVLPSLYVAVAANCCVVPFANDELAGATAIDSRFGVVTVRRVEPDVDPDVAVIVVVPWVADAARPVFDTLATDDIEDVHVAELVKSWVLPSLYVPVAVNCWVRPAARVGLAGVTAIEVKVGGVTVRPVDPLTVPDVAVIVLVPCALLVAKPVLDIVATPAAEDVHVAELVKS